MILYVFNPSHDEALAARTPYYYPTKIARQLAVEWGMLPGLWAGKGNCVWVDDGVSAEHIEQSCSTWCEGVRFVHKCDMNASFWQQVEAIEPWGWDALIRRTLEKMGAPSRLLPDDDEMERIRQLSSRYTTSAVLPQLVQKLNGKLIPAVGESRMLTTFAEVEQTVNEWGEAMVKAPWSCSGRGVFHVVSRFSESERGRVLKIIKEQGAVEMQRFYTGVFDFALEFSTDAQGETVYEGPSLFKTNPLGGYSGNLITPVEMLENELADKLGGMSQYQELVRVCLDVLAPVFYRKYAGKSGIDMMLVNTADGVAIFPCVEINVRRTMGHVALNLIKRKLKEEALPAELRKLWYFCTNLY